LFASASALPWVLPSASLAQELTSGTASESTAPIAQPQAAKSADDSLIGEIIVTAEKRDVSIQKTPIAVSAFTSEQRDLIGIKNLGDMTSFVPGLSYSSVVDHLYVRGVGRQSISLAAPAGVATFVDGFYNPNPILTVLPPLFVDQTVVLRGPQGTLGGRNGIAGALQITAKRPTDTPYAEVRGTLQNYGYYDLQGAVSGPIVDGLNFRLAAYHIEQRSGYFKDVGGGEAGGIVNDNHLEAALEAKFGERADAYLRFSTFRSTNRGGGAGSMNMNARQPYSTYLVDSVSSLIFNPAAGYNSANILPGSLVQRAASLTGNPGADDFRKFSSYDLALTKVRDAYSINGAFNYHADGFDVKYIGGYQTYNYTNQQNGGTAAQQTGVLSYVVPVAPNPTCAATGNPFTTCLIVRPRTYVNYFTTDEWFSHELNFASTHSGPLQWVAGLYYYEERFTNPVSIVAPDQAQVGTPCYLGTGGGSSSACSAGFAAISPLLAISAAPTNPTQSLLYYDYDIRSRSQAAYGQLDWQVTDTVKLTGGLRYTYDQAKGSEAARVVAFGGSALAGTPFAAPSLVGAATPAIDLTPTLCAAANASSDHAGQVSTCAVGADGVARRLLKDSSNAVTGTAGLEWTPHQGALAYARYSRGYKSFGLNAGNSLISGGPTSVAPEKMNAYELGLKQTLAGRLVVNVALFYSDYRDAQVSLTTLTSTGSQTLLTSIPKSLSKGVEIETQWAPTSALQILATYAYNDATVRSACNAAAVQTNCFQDSANPAAGFQNAKGNDLPNAPKHKVALNGNYTFDFEPGSLILSGTYTWRDKQYGSIFNEAWWRAPASSNVDLRAIWRGRGERYEAIVFVRNVFDTLQYESGPRTVLAGDPFNIATATQLINQSAAPPRTFGVELHYKFF
jgi:iron complex outermembrane receptor protein